MKRAFAFLLCAQLLCACAGSTGGEIVSFRAAASGVRADDDGTLAFDNSSGYHIVLERALLHVGALYLNASVPSSGAQATACTLPGIYVAEVLASLDIDTLSAAQQAFKTRGEGIASPAAAAEVWLSGGPIDAIDDETVIFDAAGSASKDGVDYPFSAAIHIGRNRVITDSDPALPGKNPICKQRIVSPIAVDLLPSDRGSLLLQVDPRAFFRSCDFAQLPKDPDDDTRYRFADTATNQTDLNLFDALHARTGAYRLSWQ